MAIDADHNMDMTYNLSAPENMNYIGQGLQEVLDFVGAKSTRTVFDTDNLSMFTLSPKDDITAKYSEQVNGNTHVMSTGPHTDTILYDQSCSHSLTTPLKVYLPLLKLQENDFAVVDEKAGTDGVGTGVTTGFDMPVVVAEPTVYGIKAARQIAEVLDFYKTPYVFALNKVDSDEDISLFVETVGQEPDFVFKYDKSHTKPGSEHNNNTKLELPKLQKKIQGIKNTRIERTKEKLERNKNFTK